VGDLAVLVLDLDVRRLFWVMIYDLNSLIPSSTCAHLERYVWFCISDHVVLSLTICLMFYLLNEERFLIFDRLAGLILDGLDKHT
jgi:hypothetical protein